MTIEQYLRGKVDLSISEATIGGILFDRGVAEATSVTEVTERDRDLCLADLFMFVAGSSISLSGEYESDGGWQKSRSGKNVVDRAGLRLRAKALYDKWGEKPLASIGGIVMKPIY